MPIGILWMYWKYTYKAIVNILLKNPKLNGGSTTMTLEAGKTLT
jgi:hypothetical protein